MSNGFHDPVKCPICNNNSNFWCTQQDWEYFTSDKSYDYYHCTACELLFIDPVPVAELQAIYPDNYYSFASPNQNIVFKIKEYLDRKLFKKVLRTIPGKQLKVLDIGGGTGWLLDVIKKTDTRVTATAIVDINERCAEAAQQNNHQYFLSRIEEFESNEKYDLIIMLNLLEHVEDPARVMQKISTLLSPGGRVLIKTPNCESWDRKLFRKSYWGGLHCPRHWNIFSKGAFEKTISVLPLVIDKVKYTQGAPFWTYSILVKLMGKTLQRQKKPLITHPLFPAISAFFAAVDFVRGIFVPTSQMFIMLSAKEN